MGAKQGKSRRSGRQRLALVVFGVLFVALFAGYAIAEGLGHESVPEGDVAIVEGVPDDISTVSEAEFKRALLQQAIQKGSKRAPRPSEKSYEELKNAAMSELLNSIWLQGEAEELGITATQKEVATELATIKKQNFPNEAQFQKFLKTSRLSQADVMERVKLSVLSTQTQEKIAEEAPPPTESEIADFYEATKATQYTTPATRDVRIVVNKDEGKTEAAKVLLEKDDSVGSWKKVTAKYSSDPTTKSKAGLQAGIPEQLLEGKGPLKEEIFGHPANELIGPFKFEGNYLLIEVVKLNPGSVKPLAEVKSQIKTQMTSQLAQEVFSEFVNEFQSKWRSRTICASGFVTESCNNYVGSGHPATAPASCYEANPKGAAAPECPAPVNQPQPALPGSVTILSREGQRLSQRPRPVGLKEASEEPSASPLGGAAPGGAETPPTEAPPSAGN